MILDAWSPPVVGIGIRNLLWYLQWCSQCWCFFRFCVSKQNLVFLAGALAGKKNLLRNRENRAEWTRRLIGHRHGKAHGLIGPAKERGDGLIRKRIGLSNLLSLGRFRRCSDLKPSSLPRVGRLIPLGPRWGDRHWRNSQPKGKFHNAKRSFIKNGTIARPGISFKIKLNLHRGTTGNANQHNPGRQLKNKKVGDG